MRIRYTLTRMDLVRCNIRTLLHNRLILAVWAALSAVFVLNTFNGSSKTADAHMAVKIFVALVLFLLALAAFFTATALLTALLVLCRTHKGVLGEHTLTVTTEGLVEATEHNESLHRWSAYHRTKRSGAYLFLYVTDTMAHPVPLHRPPITGDLASFEAAVRAQAGR